MSCIHVPTVDSCSIIVIIYNYGGCGHVSVCSMCRLSMHALCLGFTITVVRCVGANHHLPPLQHLAASTVTNFLLRYTFRPFSPLLSIKFGTELRTILLFNRSQNIIYPGFTGRMRRLKRKNR